MTAGNRGLSRARVAAASHLHPPIVRRVRRGRPVIRQRGRDVGRNAGMHQPADESHRTPTQHVRARDAARGAQ